MPKRTLKNAKDARKFLSKTIFALERSELDSQTARSLGYLIQVLLNALQVGELEERLARLEEIAEGRESTK